MERRNRQTRIGAHPQVSDETLQRYRQLIKVVPGHTFAIPIHELKERGLLNEQIIIERNDYMASAQQLEPFASSPSKPPKASLRGEWKDADLMQLRTFRDYWGAKKLYDYWTEFKQVRWINDTTVVAENGMVISSPDLERIVEFKLSKEQDAYVWPEPFASEVKAFLNRISTRPVNVKAETTKRAKPAREAKREPKKERAPRPDNLISVGDIAAELKIEPRIARGILRSSKTPKPDHGWAWSKAEAEKIKAIIKKGLK